MAQEGSCAAFGDIFEHEAWNDSGQTRVVLILDSSNPGLHEIERAAAGDLMATIGDFNRPPNLPLRRYSGRTARTVGVGLRWLLVAYSSLAIHTTRQGAH